MRMILLKNPNWPKINTKKDHQNTLDKNQNRLYAICGRYSLGYFHASRWYFQKRGVVQQNLYAALTLFWELQADRAPVGQLPQPANFVATGGDLEGAVHLSWDALRRSVQTYIAQQAISPRGPWTQCYVGKASSCTVTGLTSGTQYWFQVSAIDAAGPSAGSDPATKRAT